MDVQNLVEIDTAVMNLRMREEKRIFVWIFFVNISIYLSIYPVFCLGYMSHF